MSPIKFRRGIRVVAPRGGLKRGRPMIDRSKKILFEKAEKAADAVRVSVKKLTNTGETGPVLDVKSISKRVRALEDIVAKAPWQMKDYGQKLIEQTKQRVGTIKGMVDVKGTPRDIKRINLQISDPFLSGEWDRVVSKLRKK